MLSYERLRRRGPHPPSHFRPRWLHHLVRIFAITFKFHIFAQINRDLYYLLSNSMEDFILREIDRLGEMLLIIARKLGLQEDVMPDYSLLDVKDEFDKAVCPINLDALLEQENPVWYLVETEKISDHGLETFIEILFHSDLDEDRKAAILHDALAYLDGKGFFSFKLHALSNS